MEKHLVNSLNRILLEYECEGCNTTDRIPMKDFLRKKYSYEMICKNCGKHVLAASQNSNHLNYFNLKWVRENYF